MEGSKVVKFDLWEVIYGKNENRPSRALYVYPFGKGNAETIISLFRMYEKDYADMAEAKGFSRPSQQVIHSVKKTDQHPFMLIGNPEGIEAPKGVPTIPDTDPDREERPSGTMVKRTGCVMGPTLKAVRPPESKEEDGGEAPD